MHALDPTLRRRHPRPCHHRRRPGVRPGAHRLLRCGRPPAGDHRPRRRRGGRRPRRRPRPRDRDRAGRPRRRPQPRGSRRRPRAGSCSTSRRCARSRSTPSAAPPGPSTGLTARRVHRRHRRARPRDRVRRRGLGRDRRDHAQRRRRLPGAQARPHDRQPARRRGRDGGRRAPARRRRRAPGSVLGAARRRRELRGRDAAAVPPPGGGHDRRRHAVPPRDPRRHRRHSSRRRRPRRRSSRRSPTSMPAPPLPFLAPEHHGRPIAHGDARPRGRGRGRASARWRRSARWRPRSPTWSARCPTGDVPAGRGGLPPDRGRRARCSSTSIDGATAETILDRLERSTAPMAAVQLRVLGGAMARVPAEATAFAHRERRIMANVAAMFANPEERAEPRAAWVAEPGGRAG